MKILHACAFLTFLTGGALAAPVAAQSTTRVSVDSGGAEGNSSSEDPCLSADGRWVAFASSASNLVPGDANGLNDVFVHDRQTGQSTRVSVDSSGREGHGSSFLPSLSADGRFVAFESWAPDLVPADTNGVTDVFVHDRLTGQTTRVSVDAAGREGLDHSYSPSISADGRFVAFESRASNLVAGDTNGQSDVFVHDRHTGQTTRVSVDSAGLQGDQESKSPRLSLDGRTVTFQSRASNLVPADGNGRADVFVHDRQTGQTARVSVDSGGMQGDQDSFLPTLTADGRCVAFMSFSTNLVAGDTNGKSDVFVHDRQTGRTSRVSVDSSGRQGNVGSDAPALSSDGRFVAFESWDSNLVPGDTNDEPDVFLHDRLTGRTTRVSVDSGGLQGNGSSFRPALSADGLCVAFSGYASNLVPGDANGHLDAFVHDRRPGGFTLAAAGSCPGSITLTLTHATPHGFVAFMSGAAGVFVKPTPPCQGIALGIAAPTLRVTLTADAAGGVSHSFNAPAAACGFTLQAVDAATCTASNAIVL